MLTSKRTRTLLVRVALIGLPLAILVAACSDDATPDPPGTGTPTAVGGGSGQGICLLNNCTANEHCLGCSDGRNTCLTAEQRCVACDPNQPVGSQGCPEGQECSPYGICVPLGLTCPVDGQGEPTVVCNQNPDCLACSPMHQVCDPATHKCQACTETNTQHCTQNDICIDGKCAPKCPPSCTTTADCQYCGGPGNEARACFKHKCAQCTDAPQGDPLYYPCPTGQVCDNGVCVPPCGIPGPISGTCGGDDEDCHYCGGQENYGTFTCKTPVNNPDHGTCVPPFEGCEDIAPGLLLPDPWGDYSQTCSSDPNCDGVGIMYDVGQQIRDLVGSDELDLGFTEIGICTVAQNPGAAVTYEMHVCAAVEVLNEANCGICVPCREDQDCSPIDIDPLLPGIFCEDPLAMIAGALLIDLLWGDNDDHHLNFFCQDIAAGYGVCVPCLPPTSPCGSGGGGGGSGNCDHNVCEEGAALDPSCGDCEAAVCHEDPYCCDPTGAWDSTCVDEVEDYCAGGCGGSSSCAHSACEIGDGSALAPTCSDCAAAVCNMDPWCCNSGWDSQCVSEAQAEPACAAECGGGCEHDVCDEGGPMTYGCSACVSAICDADSVCCDSVWDALCVDATGDFPSDCPSCP